MPSAEETLAQVDRLLEEMIAQQRAKVLALAQRVVPSLTSEDVLNPDGYPELAEHGPFNYEDGQLAGLISCQMAIRARVARRLPGSD
jgi:hypothetical protein